MQIGYCGDTKKRCVGVTAQLGSLKIRGNQVSGWTKGISERGSEQEQNPPGMWSE